MSDDILDFNCERVDRMMADLLDSFEAHPLMQPPNTHPTVFFLFDFVRNTHRTLKSIDAEKLRAGDSESRQKASDVIGRNHFTNILVNDSTGELALMTGGDPQNPVDFGPDIKAKAQALSV